MASKKEGVEQIKKRYPNQWLLITDYETDESTMVKKGRLVAHSKCRDDIHNKLSQYGGNICIQYSGKLAKDAGVVF
ncbi:hypothetical protein LR007_00510 [candidate division NPL-UPA2 bacterium]|nr:hypothetical protein [candidate division NPL-UPA2 bacterium]